MDGKPKINTDLIPDYVGEEIGRSLLPGYQKFFSDPENERRFQAWLPGYLAREKARQAAT